MSGQEFHLKLGAIFEFERTIAESDVYMFGGITGDLSATHTSERAMRRSSYGKRIVHGALLIGYMSTASTMAADSSPNGRATETPVSLGYDRVRFIKPVFIGETITTRYEVKEIDSVRRRSRSVVSVFKEDGDVAAIAEHILKWVPNDRAA